MTSVSNDALSYAGATKLFVLLLAPEQATPPPGFLPKRTFQFRQRKGMQVPPDSMTCKTSPVCSFMPSHVQVPVRVS